MSSELPMFLNTGFPLKEMTLPRRGYKARPHDPPHPAPIHA